MPAREIGDFGENAAQEYLENNDYEILKRNLRYKFGEVDIIAEKDGCTVFVEVKTRRSTAYGTPAEFVDLKKQKRVKKAAACFRDLVNDDVRFDVIEIIYREEYGKKVVSSLNHIENAF